MRNFCPWGNPGARFLVRVLCWNVGIITASNASLLLCKEARLCRTRLGGGIAITSTALSTALRFGISVADYSINHLITNDRMEQETITLDPYFFHQFLWRRVGRKGCRNPPCPRIESACEDMQKFEICAILVNVSIFKNLLPFTSLIAE